MKIKIKIRNLRGKNLKENRKMKIEIKNMKSSKESR